MAEELKQRLKTAASTALSNGFDGDAELLMEAHNAIPDSVSARGKGTFNAGHRRQALKAVYMLDSKRKNKPNAYTIMADGIRALDRQLSELTISLAAAMQVVKPYSEAMKLVDSYDDPEAMSEEDGHKLNKLMAKADAAAKLIKDD